MWFLLLLIKTTHAIFCVNLIRICRINYKTKLTSSLVSPFSNHLLRSRRLNSDDMNHIFMLVVQPYLQAIYLTNFEVTYMHGIYIWHYIACASVKKLASNFCHNMQIWNNEWAWSLLTWNGYKSVINTNNNNNNNKYQSN